MKTKKLENPYINAMCDNDGITQCGITLRDYLANAAMQGVLSTYDSQTSFDTFKHSAEDLASTSYLLADAMLKQRELC